MPGPYDLIGAVFAQCEAAEPFYAGSASLPQIGIIAPGHPDADSSATDKALEGAVQMCEEAHYDAVVLDDAGPRFEGLDLLILPDHVVLTPTLKKKVAAYLAKGGKLLLTGRSGFDAAGKSEIPGVDLTSAGRLSSIPPSGGRRRRFLPCFRAATALFICRGKTSRRAGA